MILKINDIIDWLINSSPILNAPDFRQVIKINFKHKFTSPFEGILMKAFNDFQLKYPLLMWDRKIYSDGISKVKFIDNYQAYLDGKIDEDHIELIPSSILHYTDGLLRAYRDFTYINPYIRIPRSGLYKISYFTKYKMIFDIDEKTDTFTDKAHIYGISMESGDDWTYLSYFIEKYTLEYLKIQKGQMTYSEMPLEFFTGLEERLSDLNTDIQDWQQNPIWYGKLYI